MTQLFPLSQLFLALTIFVARVADVSLGTFRQAMVIRGKKLYAFLLAFAESLIWVFAVSKVLTDIDGPITALAFAGGFAVGTFVGIWIEDLFKIGEQAVRIFSVDGDSIAASLRKEGFRVTVFDGRGRDGKVNLLFVQVRRREVGKVRNLSRTIDPQCYLVIDDVRAISYGSLEVGK